jgi:hypothetical protein
MSSKKLKTWQIRERRVARELFAGAKPQKRRIDDLLKENPVLLALTSYNVPGEEWIDAWNIPNLEVNDKLYQLGFVESAKATKKGLEITTRNGLYLSRLINVQGRDFGWQLWESPIIYSSQEYGPKLYLGKEVEDYFTNKGELLPLLRRLEEIKLVRCDGEIRKFREEMTARYAHKP